MTLSPSHASRRMACPGSHALEALFPQDNSDHAQEGILAHKIAAETLRNNCYVSHPDETDEMREGAELYHGFVYSRLSATSKIFIEQPLDISVIHPDCRGIPDCWTLLSDIELDIFDYKFGHSFVEVYENWQLIEYAAGILEYLQIDGMRDQHMWVNMHIIQPRSFHPEGQIRTWRMKACDLRPYFNRLRESEYAALQPNASCTPSPQCYNCAARHACVALQAAAMDSVDVSYSAIPHNMAARELSTELRTLEHAAARLKDRIAGLSAEALAMISRGERLPHHHGERGRGRERWSIPVEEVIELGELYGIELRKPAAITPKQAAALASDVLTPERIRELSETPIGELKLVPVDTRKTDKMFRST